MDKFDFVGNQLILKPYLGGCCDKCINHYFLDGTDRCKAIAVDNQDATCIHIVRCINFEEVCANNYVDYWDGSGD